MEQTFGIYAVVILLLLFLLFYGYEKARHEKNLKTIKHRIWVNGTRGKSSVTRLIAAGLRAANKTVIAKTTGTSPRFITTNKEEQQVTRLGMPNIKEQLRIIDRARHYRPHAIVLECMALRPDLQKTEATQMVKPDIVAITNVRPDHLDVMGPTKKHIAKAFLDAVPKNCHVFTTAVNTFDDYQRLIKKKKIKMMLVSNSTIKECTPSDFSYIEHEENICLALEVCKFIGISNDVAIKGMQNMTPDPGALKKYLLKLGAKQVTMINAMAANDPESTYLIWQATDKKHSAVYLLVNCRDDRMDRSFQIAELIKNHIKAAHYILTGSGTKVLKKHLARTIPVDFITDLGGQEPVATVERIAEIVADKSMIFALGNTVGYGSELIDQFLIHRSKPC